MARCAVCYEEYEQGEKLALQSEFTVHRGCAGSKPQVVRDYENAIRDMRAVRERVERQDAAMTRLERALEQVRGRSEQFLEERQRLDAVIDDLRRECRLKDEEVLRLRQDLLAAQQALRQQGIAVQREEDLPDDRDPLTIRAELLELD